jgi:hypothetical protein
MLNLKLKVNIVSQNGSVLMIPAERFEKYPVEKSTGKKLTDAQLKKLKPSEVEIQIKEIHPNCRLNMMVKDIKNFKVGDVYEATLKKVSK